MGFWVVGFWGKFKRSLKTVVKRLAALSEPPVERAVCLGSWPSARAVIPLVVLREQRAPEQRELSVRIQVPVLVLDCLCLLVLSKFSMLKAAIKSSLEPVFPPTPCQVLSR